MDNLKAFGAGMAGGEFDHKAFIKKPSVLCKIGAAVLSGGIWYCMYKGAWHKEIINAHQQVCLFNASSTTCSFISAMGFFSLLGALALIAADAQFDKISAVQTRSRVVRADLGICSFFSIIFVLTFLNAASKYGSLDLVGTYDSRYVKTVILFCLLNAAAWGGAVFLAWRRFQASGLEQPFQSNEYQTDFQGINSEVSDGYGYGGNSEGIGAVGGVSTSYQAAAPPPQQQQAPQMAPTNPFYGQAGYQY